MAITKSEFSNYIKTFRFRELFNEMGWNNDRTKQTIVVDEIAYNFFGIAEKSGFRIFVCESVDRNKLPVSAARKKIESKLTKLFQEHLIIFIDEQKREQVWQLAVRKAASPTKISETRYNISQNPELLYQRASGLFFTLDEEEKVTIIDVTKRVADNFQQNNERVTKRFYESFKKEHAAFLKFIIGIDEQLKMDWYASLMLNRLMFCYFIQKKGFLDNNKNYLQDKLSACIKKRGKNKFYSFYRDFLIALFHKGLGTPEHDKNLEIEIGKIPYLNGGLFDEHEIEKTYENISIDDKAFENLFDFFDQYEWHLDTRETASGRDINPDVIGYIFEKYINDRARMGAYYTKEDITDYISKNCIIPWLFDEVKRQHPKAFGDDCWLWQMLKISGDEYIYEAMKYGIPESGGLFDDLPSEIKKGFVSELEKKFIDGNGPWLWELRKDWNKPAPFDIALPSEIYREVIQRRNRCADIRSKIANGEIREINDFITYNLNIRQFAQDAIETTDDVEYISHFYKALSSITILDPTCGSGAFLFAAMNILEPLYEACVHRMKTFIDESGKGKHKFFEETLAQVNAPEHPNLQYFIYKSIILNNLYGVDIMNEAVEIAKLRLFLKLVATVDADYQKPNLGIEPLPDIDFNIRSGNTLVGYVAMNEVKKSMEGDWVKQLELPRIHEQAEDTGRAFQLFREMQTNEGMDAREFKEAKQKVGESLKALEDELNRYLAKEYGVDVEKKAAYAKWVKSHQPFHWFVEFFGIMQRGGFDVIIGNPPYVEYKTVANQYTIHNFVTEACGNLYTYVVEKSFNLANSFGKIGLIVPISLTAAQRMATLQELIISNSNLLLLSNFGLRPASLFPGIMQRLSILITSKGNSGPVYTSDYITWYAEEREVLFFQLKFFPVGKLRQAYSIPKTNNGLAHSALSKILSKRRPYQHYNQLKGDHCIYYHNAGGYWIKTFNFKPYYRSLKYSQKNHTTISTLCFSSSDLADTYLCILNSSLFYFFWKSLTDARHVYPSDIAMLPIELPLKKPDIESIRKISNELMGAFKKNRKRIIYGDAEVDQFYVSPAKHILDKIDRVLAKHYGFTEEELDFIINYDIKYRMGRETIEEEV